MTPKEYIENVKKTESSNFQTIFERLSDFSILRLDHASDGLVTEAGEFKDALKKCKFYGKSLDRTNLIEELGDILWYIGIACDELNISIEEVMEINIAKLFKRYGMYFNEDGALNKDLTAERYILEKDNTQLEDDIFPTGTEICSACQPTYSNKPTNYKCIDLHHTVFTIDDVTLNHGGKGNHYYHAKCLSGPAIGARINVYHNKIVLVHKRI